jgi:hypothetical protein
MAHLDLSKVDGRTAAEVAEMYVQRSHTMLLAAGVASFTIVGVAAIVMALLF